MKINNKNSSNNVDIQHGRAVLCNRIMVIYIGEYHCRNGGLGGGLRNFDVLFHFQRSKSY